MTFNHLRTRAYSKASKASIDAHRWALLQFTARTHLNHPDAHPAALTRAHLFLPQTQPT